jgi:hypothetical protein
MTRLRATSIVPGVVSMQPQFIIPFALTLVGGTWIIVSFMVLGFFVLAFSAYTRAGSAINQHPYGDLDHNSGPETPSELAHDTTQDTTNWQRGVGNHRRRGRGRR